MERVGGVDTLPKPHLLYLHRPDRKRGQQRTWAEGRGVRNIREETNSIHEKREQQRTWTEETRVKRCHKGVIRIIVVSVH